MQQFNIPVVLFTFKRKQKTLEILEVIARIKPRTLYILSDQGRSESEIELVAELRREVESRITWECNVIKKYAESNLGVYKNIGEGSKWVLEREKWAIFLEDDNLPEFTFFKFCQEMLEMYEFDSRILWVCGTNYLKKYNPMDGCSYMFTQHMLPCGWASWSNKFINFYDGNLSLWQDPCLREKIAYEYKNKKLLKQDSGNWDRELRRVLKGLKPDSWDYQMSLAIRANGLLGIVPGNNQIKNIGVDLDSTHGGSSFDLEMTKRFCGLSTMEIIFPLAHPKSVLIDFDFERKIENIVLLPWKQRAKISLASFLKRIINVDVDESLTGVCKIKLKKIMKIVIHKK